MKTINLTVTSPDGIVFSGEAVKITLRGSEGELAVLADHIPFMTTAKPCTWSIELEDGSVKTGEMLGGILSVGQNNEVTCICS